MTTSQPVASEQYRLSQKYPSNREPTHEEWLREIEALRAINRNRHGRRKVMIKVAMALIWLVLCMWGFAWLVEMLAPGQRCTAWWCLPYFITAICVSALGVFAIAFIEEK